MPHGVAESSIQSVQLVRKRGRGNLAPAFNDPAFAMPRQNVPDGGVLEKRSQRFDAEQAAFNRALLHCVLSRGEPAAGNTVKADVGILSQGKIADLLAEFSEAALGELSVLRLERTSKLLVAPFQQGVISARGIESVQIFPDLVERGYASRIWCCRNCLNS